MTGTTVVTQRSEFECSYIMMMDNDKLQLHSHHYKIEISVSGNQRMEDNGFILEFSQFKKLLDSVLPDHAFLYNVDKSTNTSAEIIVADVLSDAGLSVIDISFSPSAENLVNYIVESLQYVLNRVAPGVTIVDAKLRESSDSFAQWSKSI